jgi:hypothetical protein
VCLSSPSAILPRVQDSGKIVFPQCPIFGTRGSMWHSRGILLLPWWEPCPRAQPGRRAVPVHNIWAAHRTRRAPGPTAAACMPLGAPQGPDVPSLIIVRISSVPAVIIVDGPPLLRCCLCCVEIRRHKIKASQNQPCACYFRFGIDDLHRPTVTIFFVLPLLFLFCN